MDKFFFFIFMIIVCGYLWADSYNRKQKQHFRQTIYQCEIKTKSQLKDDGSICLADGNIPCHLLKNWDKVEGMLCLAENYRNGIDLLFSDKKYGQDLQKSAYWYEQLALKGHQEAQFEMANILEQGMGVEKDLQNANAWYYQAYISGNLEAGFIFANHLEQGKGIDKNHQQALFLYHELANIYYEPAIFKMGEIYDKGLLGVQENNQTALAYFNKIPNYRGVSGINGKLQQIHMEISIAQSIAQNPIPKQTPQTQYTNDTNNPYLSEYYGHSSECTAICYDGTCSKSLGRRGVCSHHGGVRYWLK